MSDEDQVAQPHIDETPSDDAPDTPATACCEFLDTCCGADLDSEDLSLLSLGAGIAACAFATFGLAGWTHILALPFGAAAIYCGYRALKEDTPREQAATFGVGSGALALAMWLITRGWMNVVEWLGR